MNMPPLNRFTTKAKDVVRKAHEIAIERGQNTVTPSHILASLLLLDDGIVVSVFEKLDLDYPLFLDNLLERISNIESSVSNTTSPSYQMFLSPELIISLEEAEKISKEMGDNFIATEHIFLSLLLNPDENISDLASEFKIEEKKIFEIIFKLKESGEKIEKKQSFKNLKRFAKDLTELAEKNKLDPVIGRENEIERSIQILSRRKKNNPILVGEAGVGKTAVVEGIAQKIVEKNIPKNLENKKIYSLDMGLLIAGTKFRGEFEDRLKSVLKEVNSANGDIILFIDEVHSIVGAGASDGSMDASNLLKPALARGELSLIGATTFDEYKKYIEKDSALSRRFQMVKVDEPNIKKSLDILKGLRDRYEIFHGIKITDEALESSIKLSSRYITDRKLPDKAIDLIDEASSKAKITIHSQPKKLNTLEKEILHLEIKKKFLEKDSNSKKEVKSIKKEISDLQEEVNDIKIRWEKEKEIVEKIKNLQGIISKIKRDVLILKADKKIDEVLDLEYIQLEAYKKTLEREEKKIKKLQSKRRFIYQEIGSYEIEKIVSNWTGIPVEKMNMEELKKISAIQDYLKNEIIGQDDIIEKVSLAIKRSYAGISNPEKPIASFLFLGSTGIGKTELAKKISEFLFDNKNSLIKVDMSELMESHSVSKLIGSPPGYVGYDEGGSLTEKIKRNPYSVILFDEIEKASPNILNILLQILDEGKVTDSKGQEINFKNTIIILTSNVGSGEIKEKEKIGFEILVDRAEEILKNKREERIKSSLKSYFNPEFLNRLDEIFIFKNLVKDDIVKIINLEVKKISERLKLKSLDIKISDEVIANILDDDYNFEYGARPVKRLLENKIINPLTEEILKGDKNKGIFMITLKNKKINFKFGKIKKKKTGKNKNKQTLVVKT